MAATDTPKFVLFTMDDDMTREKYSLVKSFLKDRLNPNGCPVLATFFLSATTDLTDVKKLYGEGKEVE